MDIDETYKKYCSTYCDIHEHLPTLYKYGLDCNSVIEAGVRDCISTWAFLKAIKDKGCGKLIGLDLSKSSQANVVEYTCKQKNIDYKFVAGNDLDYNVEEDIDLVFIDTWHVYGHLKRELAKFAPKCKKYIIMHDTTVDCYVGESIRMHFDIEKQAKESGYPIKEIVVGLWPAVQEFLDENKEWVLEHRYVNNNGLTILKRIAQDSEPIRDRF